MCVCVGGGEGEDVDPFLLTGYFTRKKAQKVPVKKIIITVKISEILPKKLYF